MVFVPKIETPEVTVANVPQQSYDVHTSPETFGAGVGQAVRQLGGDISKASNDITGAVKQHLELQNNTQALSNGNTAYDQAAAREGAFKALRGKDAVAPDENGVTPLQKYNQDLQDIFNNNAAGLSPYAKEKYTQLIEKQKFYLERGAADYVAQQTKTWHTQEASHAAQTAIREAGMNSTDPNAVAASWQKVSDAARSISQVNGGDEDYEEGLKSSYGAKFDAALIKNRAVADPHGTLSDLQDPDKFPYTDPATRAWWTSKLEKKFKTSAVNTDTTYDCSVSTDKLLTQSAGNPVAQLDIAKDSTAYTSAAEDHQEITSTQGENQQRLQQAVSVKQTMLAPTGDPAGYLYSHNIDLQSSVQGALQGGQTPGAPSPTTQLSHAIKEADLTYNSIGQDPNNRPILSKQLAQNTVQGITSGGPQAGFDKLYQMQQQYGKQNFSRVYDDLVSRGGLPVEYQLAMNMGDPRDRAQLAKAYTVDPEEAKKGGGLDLPNTKMKGIEPVKNTIDNGVNYDDLLHKYTASINLQSGGASNASDYTSAIKRLAYQKYREGADPKTAYTQAVSAVVGNVDMSLGGSRIPMDVAPVVKSNAVAFMDKLDPSQLSIPHYAASGADYVTQIKGYSTWINNRDDSGLNLLDAHGYLVRGADNRPVSMPFSWAKQGVAAHGSNLIPAQENGQ